MFLLHVAVTITCGNSIILSSQAFHDRVIAKADVLQATGDAIASFSEMQCLTPRWVVVVVVYI